MPEGHSVHRIARQFKQNFVGTNPLVTSPQGRFALGAELISGLPMTDSRAVGKQMFLEFDEHKWLRVHLGIYGAWDFSGDVLVHPSIMIHPANATDEEAEDSVASIGAPRKTRNLHLRMAEEDKETVMLESFPPEPVGQVRVRLLNKTVCADLRGPTVCEVISPEEVQVVLDRLGPDPANDASEAEMERFIERALRKKTSIAAVLMDQSVIAGIGNVYRAEMLFRAGINPHTPAASLGKAKLEELWFDWVHLLEDGIRVGQMITIDGLAGEAYQKALRVRDDRHWVYRLNGTPCKRCGTNIVLEELNARKLYWCPNCQK